MAKKKAGKQDAEKLRILPETAGATEKDGTLRSFKDPAGTLFTARSAKGAIDKFLKAQQDELRTGEVDLEEIDSAEGAAVVRRRYQQKLNGLQLIGAELKVVADKTRNSVISADSSIDHDTDEAPNTDEARPFDSVEDTILAPFADDYGSASVTGWELSYLRDNQRPPLPEYDYPGATVELLSIGKKADRKIHLVYAAIVETDDPYFVFRVFLDAVTGRLMYIEMVTKYVTADLKVFVPDPVTQSNNTTLGVGSTAAQLNPFRHDEQAEVDPASGGKFRLDGDWVRCRELDAPAFAQPEENTADFEYQTYPNDRKFLSANAYYWLDAIARYLQTLGVTTFNNNVELIEVDAQAWSGADQSDWVGSANPPRIRLGEGGVPDAADMAVIIHEYTHGVFDWLGSNHGGSGSYEHSVCDALPAIYRDRFNPNGFQRTITFPFDNVNNLWSSQRTLDRAERFDDAGFGGYGSNLRNSMLGTALWDCYIGMGGDSSHAAVRQAAADAMIRTMMEMLLIVPDDNSTSLAHAVSMAKGCITADTALTGGLYSKVMDQAFIDRGLWTLRPIDIYIRDSAADTGALPSPIPHWTSPDIWVRNNPPGAGENPADGHQAPITNQTNYLYVKVRNRGNTAAAANAFSVEAFRCNPGTGMIFPTHFTSIGTISVNQQIPAGGDVQVGPFTWTPTVVGHECLLAIAHGTDDPAISATLLNPVPHGQIVRFDNNVGQRNVAPIASVPGGKTKSSFVLRGGLSPSTNRLTLDATALPADTSITVRTLTRVVEGSELTGLARISTGSVWSKLALQGGEVGEVDGFALGTNDSATVELEIDFSLQAEHLEIYPIIATHTQDGLVVGRMTIEITSVKELEDWVFGNPRSLELHVVGCPFWPQISSRNKVPFELVQDGIARGYNGCRFCLPSFDTD